MRNGIPALRLAYTQVCCYRTWVTNIFFILHILACQRRTWSDNIVCPLNTSVCRHPTWLATIIQSMQNLVCWHSIWPSCIVFSLHSSICRYRPKTCSISQGMHAFVVAYVNMGKDVDQWHAATAKAEMRGWGIYVSFKQVWTKVCGITKGRHAWTWHVCI